ncbi:AMP-binding protein [Sulfobacillus thermosulfidooxidans]|uniref:AMP-binding protein n=1 Tax=Sulfobacillus thermosulfidooxidans TaxID=28034 RepID=UPI0006B54353|nr:AMP-binding protein [Sulfobacillus thermosulfidooxidans]
MIVPERLNQVPDERPAIYSPDTEHPLSYGQLRQWAKEVSQGLLCREIQAGDVVMYQLPNHREFAVLTLALWNIGAIPCPVLPQLNRHELHFIAQTTKTRCVIAWKTWRKTDYQKLYQVAFAELPHVQQIFLDPEKKGQIWHDFGGLAHRAPLTDLRWESDSPAQILFTSGTTGVPKGVVHTHRTLAQALQAHTDSLHLGADDTVWVPSPLAHQTGFLYGMMLAWYLGSAAIYQACWDPLHIKEIMRRFQPRFIQAALPFLRDVLDVTPTISSLRYFIVTGAPVPRELAAQARQRLQCHVSGAWGSTECCLATVSTPEDPPEKGWQTDGKPLPGTHLRIVDDQGRIRAAGEEGRLHVKTPYTFVTYLNQPEERTRKLNDEGFFDTGDMAYLDAEGFLHLTGRVQDAINRGGEKIPVKVLEDMLYTHPKIVDAALFGISDPRLGERIGLACVIEPHSTLSLEEVTEFLRDKGIAKIYWPERLWLLESLPRTASGKIQKYVLKQQFTDTLSTKGD